MNVAGSNEGFIHRLNQSVLPVGGQQICSQSFKSKPFKNAFMDLVPRVVGYSTEV
jgi:hypothetical protein